MCDQIVRCAICGSPRITLVRKTKDYGRNKLDKSYALYRCWNCDVKFVYPFPNENEISSFYGDNYYSYTQKANSKHLRKFDEKDIEESNLIRMLDVGCGTGYELIKYEAPNVKLYGVEISRRAASVAASVGINTFVGSLEDAQYPSKFFDLIIMYNVLEHLPNPLEAMKECGRILKQQGIILLVVPNCGSPVAAYLGEQWPHWDVPRHIFFYNAFSLNYLLHKAGLVVFNCSEFERMNIQKARRPDSILSLRSRIIRSEGGYLRRLYRGLKSRSPARSKIILVAMSLNKYFVSKILAQIYSKRQESSEFLRICVKKIHCHNDQL